MMPGDEPRHDLDDVAWHRHGFDQIISCVCKGLTFRRISCDGQQFIRRVRRNRTHNHPQRGGRSEINAIIDGLGPVQLDLGPTRRGQP